MPETATPTIAPLLTDAEVAGILSISEITLRKWRCSKRHALPFLRIGRTVRYRERDVQKFIDGKIIKPCEAIN